MLIELKRAARIWHKAGEIVEVSPAEAEFLISVESARPVEKRTETPEKTVKKRTKA